MIKTLKFKTLVLPQFDWSEKYDRGIFWWEFSIWMYYIFYLQIFKPSHHELSNIF